MIEESKMFTGANTPEKETKLDINELIERTTKYITSENEKISDEKLERDDKSELEYKMATKKAAELQEKIKKIKQTDVFRITMESRRKYTQHSPHPESRIFKNSEIVTIKLSITDKGGHVMQPSFNVEVKSDSNVEELLCKVENMLAEELNEIEKN